MLRKPFGFPSVKGEFANIAVAIWFRNQSVAEEPTSRKILHGRKLVPTGCKARPARNFLIISDSELKSRLTCK